MKVTGYEKRIQKLEKRPAIIGGGGTSTTSVEIDTSNLQTKTYTQSTQPDGIDGDFWFDTVNLILYVYASGWNLVGSGTPPTPPDLTGQPYGLLLSLTHPS